MSERLYDYTLQRETGDASNFYWGNVNNQLTLTELEKAYKSEGNGQLRKAFGSFDNYLAYMNERQDLIDSGELKADWWNTGQPLVTADQLGNKQVDDRTQEGMLIQAGVQQGEIGYNAQAELQESLYQKYTGEQGNVHYNSDGDIFRWNGSSYVKTGKVDDHAYGSMLGNALPGIVLTAGLAGPLGGMLSNATGSAAVGKGLAAGVANAGSQYIATGSVDPKSVLSSAVIAGVDPGGMLSDNLGKITGTGTNLVPENVVGGFVQGATNSSVGQLITDGSVDLESALIAGGIGAGTKAITDLFDDTSQHSIESKMRQIAAERAAQKLPPLSASELYDAALGALSLGNTSGSGMGPPEYGGPNSMVGKTDLAGLIGKDGLLSFIPALPTTGFNRVLGGGQWAIGEYFIGPDGKRYTDTEMWEMGVDPVAAYNGELDGWEHFKDPATPIDTNSNGFLDALANEEFENTYGINPDAYIAAGGSAKDLLRIISYGELDETYNFSTNPRGSSQYVGLLTGVDDGFSTGSNNISANLDSGEGRSIADALEISDMQDASDAAKDAILEGGNPSVIVNIDGGTTVVDGNAVLPGSNTTVTDAVLQGIIDGVLVSDDDLIAGTVPGSKDETGSSITVPNDKGGSKDTGGEVITGDDANNDELTASDINEVSRPEKEIELPIDPDDELTASDINEVSRPETDIELPIDPDDELPASSGGGGDGGISFPSISGSGLPLIWSGLFPYKKFKGYSKDRQKLYEEMMKGLGATGLFAQASGMSPMERELYEAGELKR